MKALYVKLAKTLCGHSTKIASGEHVLIDATDTPSAFIEALIDEISARRAYAHVEISDRRVSRKLALAAEADGLSLEADCALYKMQKMNAYIAVRGAENIFETSDVPHEKMAAVSAAMKDVLDWRVRKTKWVVLRWPTPAMAQLAQMSTEAFEKFYFDVCTMDYSKMELGMQSMKELMEATDEVRITGEGTDLTFSIKGMTAIGCGGQYNIPDGEIFTAPVRDSVNGVITYNAPTVYNGVSFDSVRLEFKDGKIVKASSPSNAKKLGEILSTDAGARYVGEFAMGFNPFVKTPMRDILFDEKIAGSFHFTPGQAYDEADNGNRSQIHWDLVCIQTPEYGGGEIRFDGKLIRKDGLFIGEGIDRLNPEYLLG